MPGTDKAQTALNAILKSFETGEVCEAMARTSISKRRGTIPSDRWTPTNRYLMRLMCGTDDARGFRQWQEVGRHVKRGAMAGYILGPIIVNSSKAKGKKTEREDEDGKILVGFRAIPIFSFEDTDGAALPEDQRPEYLDPKDLPPLWEVAERLGVEVKYIEHFAKEAKKDPHRACLAVITEVEKVLSLILSKEQETQKAAA